MNIIERQDLPQDTLREQVESAVVRFAGDSGDGMQVTGGQFTLATALAGNDLATFPDYPAEIRAPAGTTFGVSSFQINFGSRVIKTSGDSFDVLVAMNPAALKVELPGLKPGGVIVVDTRDFDERHLRRAGIDSNPLEDGSLDPYRVIALDISQLTMDAVAEHGLNKKEALRCKNFWALGYIYWMFARDRAPTVEWLREKFAKLPDVAEANIAALNAGHALAETAEQQDNFHGFALAKAEIAALAPRPVILVGGTGLYLKALYEGLSEIPEPETAVRNAAQARLDALGLAGFRAEVVARDPGTPDSVIDPQRLLRSWAVHEATGRALSQWQGERVGGLGPFPVFDLAPDRDDLHARINQRFGMMLEAGALAEVAALAGQDLPSSLPIMRAVGVPELLSVLNGERDQAEATERACAASRQYAKRQLTWGRNQLRYAIKFQKYPIELSFIEKIKADILSVIG